MEQRTFKLGGIAAAVATAVLHMGGASAQEAAHARDPRVPADLEDWPLCLVLALQLGHQFGSVFHHTAKLVHAETATPVTKS